jgi:uncharacterized membrane protein
MDRVTTLSSHAPVSDRLRRAIRWVLLAGVTLSSVLLLVGVILLAGAGNGSIHTAPSRPAWGSIPGDLLSANGDGYLLIGVAVLLVTPIACVVLSLATFASADDVPFTLITTVVTVLLLLGIIFGLHP